MTLKIHSYFRNKLLYGNGPNKFNSNLGKDINSLDLPKVDI